MRKLFHFELDKLYRNNTFIIGFLIFLVTCWGFYYVLFFQSQLTGIKTIHAVHGKAAVEKNEQIASHYQGPLTDEKIEQIVSDYLNERFKGNSEFFDMFSYYTINSLVNDKFDFYNQIADAKEEDRILTIQDISLKSIDTLGFSIPIERLSIGNFASWKCLFDVVSRSFILIALFVIFICSTVFANEFSRHTLPLLSSTKFGRNKLSIAKLMASLVVSLSLYAVAQIMTLTVFGQYFGFSGWDVSIQTNFIWRLFDFPIPWNNLQTLLFLFGLQIVGLFAIIGITTLISSLVPSSFIALVISVSLFFAPSLLLKVFPTGLINRILLLFPINLIDLKQILKLFYTPNAFFLKSFSANLLLVVLIFLLDKLISDGIVYYRMKNFKIN